jgi:SAM-dependent methyltransferase
VTDRPSCWCGNSELVPFAPGYFRCARCETLVRSQMPGPEIARVVDDGVEFYGREYWFSHQERDLGDPNILVRARADLPERCLHWLRTVLRYKLPPGRVLELGSGPGGFVAMLQWAGFDATGLEISPWVVQFIRETFRIPVLLGPIEDQQIEPASLDVIALMDVLEHLPDPAGTMRHCLDLLKPEGILLIQTPCYLEGRTHEEMVAQRHRFLEMLKPTDHLYLFSRRSIRDLFQRLGAEHVLFEAALFAEYDMFVVVSRVPPVTHGSAEIDTTLSARPAGRMIQALLDLDVDRSRLMRRYAESEADREARLEALEAQGRRLGEAEGERNALRTEVSALQRHVEVIEADRAARLEVIHAQGRRLGDLEALQELIKVIQNTRAYKLLRRLGRWKWIEQGIAQSQVDSRTAEEMRFDAGYAGIREPKKKEWVLYGPGAEDRIAERLRAVGFDVRRYEVDVADYRRYFAAARYLDVFPDYYAFNRAEKSLEHYLAAKLLELGEEDIYIDIASEHSPAPDIYRSLFGVTTYRQDLAYRSGLDGDRIGGDASHLPVPGEFATKMGLHCSFEHFEGESDIGFVREARRVLRPGGAICIVPLYLFEEYAVQTDPEVAVPAGVVFENDAIVCCARGWGNRYGRFYDPDHLAARILANAGGLTVEIYRIVNAAQVDASCYVRFAMLIRKPAAEPS